MIGYGKMGKAIEKIALERGHEISFKSSDPDWDISQLNNSDVAIEFTIPEAAKANIHKCFEADVPVVVGTTGWYDHFSELAGEAETKGRGLFTATNFSIGVNIMFYMNEKLAKIMNRFPEYDVTMEETHHIHKKDHPSGTASTLASDIVMQLDRKNNYVGQLEGQEDALSPFDLQILCKRLNEVPGDHAVTYTSDIDELTISHSAKSRIGFAKGAVLAAEWMKGKSGVYGMKDLLDFN